MSTRLPAQIINGQGNRYGSNNLDASHFTMVILKYGISRYLNIMAKQQPLKRIRLLFYLICMY